MGAKRKARAAAAAQLRTILPLALDGTYSAKAFALALEMGARTPTLFWLTFDPRTLGATGP